MYNTLTWKIDYVEMHDPHKHVCVEEQTDGALPTRDFSRSSVKFSFEDFEREF